MLKLKNAIAKYRAVPVATGLVAVAMPITAYASESSGAGTLSDTQMCIRDRFYPEPGISAAVYAA